MTKNPIYKLIDRSIIDRIVSEDFDHEAFALRVQEQPFTLGPINHVSVTWDAGFETDEELPGICGTDVNYTGPLPEYIGEHIALLGGRPGAYGEDPGEVILADAEVLHIFA